MAWSSQKLKRERVIIRVEVVDQMATYMGEQHGRGALVNNEATHVLTTVKVVVERIQGTRVPEYRLPFMVGSILRAIAPTEWKQI
jgi:hypothetical protein